MRQWSIVTKITVSVLGILIVLVLVSGFLLVRFEIHKEQRIVEQFRGTILNSLADRKTEEQDTLQRNVAFHAAILSHSGAGDLYNLRTEELKKTLRSYLEYPEIVAIHVLDEFEETFAAAWKNEEDIVTGRTLPESLTLSNMQSVQAEAVYEGQVVGQFRIFYTDNIITRKISQLRAHADRRIENFQQASHERLFEAILLQAGGAAIILVVLVTFLIASLQGFIFKPLSHLSHIARRLADFDLTVTLDTSRNDEVGKLLCAIQKMVHSFRSLVSQVQQSGLQVASSARELSVSAKQQEATLKTQTKSTHEVQQSVEHISEVAADLTETMQHVATLSGDTASFASNSQSDLSRMEHTIHQMGDASKTISRKLAAIDEKAENITSVVTTITQVADQTNLLSLNAAIEAEKAGEYGRGFAVVAREIRRLADQTAVATLDIERMIQEMQTAVAAGVTEMNHFMSKVDESVQDVERIGAHLNQIISQVQSLSPNFEHVKASMNQQSEYTQQIHSNISFLSDEISQTTSSLHETFLAIKQLHESAENLKHDVSAFKVE